MVRVADTVDRRAKNVVLTPKGRAFWSSLQPRIYEFYRQALASFRFDDKVSLVHFLNQLNGGMADVHLDGAEGDAAGRFVGRACDPGSLLTSGRS